MLALASDARLKRENLLGHARALPLSRVSGARRIIRRPEEEDFRARHLQKGINVPAALDGLNDGNHKDILVGFPDVFGKTLSPAGRALRSHTSHSLGRIMREGHGLAQLIRGLDPGHHHPIRPDIEGAFDQAHIQFGHSHQSHRIAPYGGANVRENVLPVEVTVFGIHHNPVYAQGHGHFRDAGRLQGDPKPVNRLIGRQLLAQLPNGRRLHLFSSCDEKACVAHILNVRREECKTTGKAPLSLFAQFSPEIALHGAPRS